MPEIAATFDPSVPGTGQITVGSPNPGGHLIVNNESPYMIRFDIDMQGVYIVLPYTADIIPLVLATQRINWRQIAVLQASGPPLSVCYVIRYGAEEKIAGHYPLSLPRLQNIGNTVNVANQFVSGTAFPVAPNVSDLFFRSDVGMLFFCVATSITPGQNKWISQQTWPMIWSQVSGPAQPFNAAGGAVTFEAGVFQGVAGALQGTGGGITIDSIIQSMFINAPCDATNYWTVTSQLWSNGGALITNLLVSVLKFSAAWNYFHGFGDYTIYPSGAYIQIAAVPTGAPGALYTQNTINYRQGALA